MKDVYRLVYTSINLLDGTESERAAAVAEILTISQRNNSKVGVTGALLFNSGCFAQVLEGPQKAVETTFERIQRDPRHSDVSVLQCEAVEARGFPNWSMAFIGHSARGRALWNEIASRTGFDLSRMKGDQLFATLHAIVEADEGLDTAAQSVVVGAATVSSQPAAASSASPTAERNERLDVERVRSELGDRKAGFRALATGGTPSASIPTLPHLGERSDAAKVGAHDVAVLRDALMEERQRTTDLRRLLDEAHIALAIMQDDVGTLRRHRDHWADRARALAAVLCQEPASPDNSAYPFSVNQALAS